MKETGIIMSGSHPVDIIDGRKTMTRRTWGLEIINKPPQNVADWHLVSVFQDGCARFATSGSGDITLQCPYGGYGDRLWVRETWATYGAMNRYKPSLLPHNEYIAFRASCEYPHQYTWRPSIFMPRWASRITLEITAIRVERLQEITEEDAKAEGVTCCPNAVSDYKHHFMILWDSLNAERGYGWDKNPWVWVIEFKLVDKEGEI